MSLYSIHLIYIHIIHTYILRKPGRSGKHTQSQSQHTGTNQTTPTHIYILIITHSTPTSPHSFVGWGKNNNLWCLNFRQFHIWCLIFRQNTGMQVPCQTGFCLFFRHACPFFRQNLGVCKNRANPSKGLKSVIKSMTYNRLQESCQSCKLCNQCIAGLQEYHA